MTLMEEVYMFFYVVDTHAVHAGVPCLGDPHSQIVITQLVSVVPLGREGPRVNPPARSSLLAVLGAVA